jgi:YidC/Oxa1 family membrane protein insertase
MFLLKELLYRPIFNILIFFLWVFNWNLWWAIIALTLLIRLSLLKTSAAWNKMQSQMSDLQPKMKEIQEKYKDDPAQMQKEMMKIFKWKSSPFKWCMWMLVQMPVFLWLFYVIRDFSLQKGSTTTIYSFLEPLASQYLNIANIDHMFLWIDLFQQWQTQNLILAIIVAIFMYWQMKLASLNKTETPQQTLPNGQKMPDMSKMMWTMNIFMSWMMWFFTYSVQAWVWLYLLTTTLFWVIQYLYQYRVLLKIKFDALLWNQTIIKKIN